MAIDAPGQHRRGGWLPPAGRAGPAASRTRPARSRAPIGPAIPASPWQAGRPGHSSPHLPHPAWRAATAGGRRGCSGLVLNGCRSHGRRYEMGHTRSYPGLTGRVRSRSTTRTSSSCVRSCRCFSVGIDWWERPMGIVDGTVSRASLEGPASHACLVIGRRWVSRRRLTTSPGHAATSRRRARRLCRRGTAARAGRWARRCCASVPALGMTRRRPGGLPGRPRQPAAPRSLGITWGHASGATLRDRGPAGRGGAGARSSSW